VQKPYLSTNKNEHIAMPYSVLMCEYGEDFYHYLSPENIRKLDLDGGFDEYTHAGQTALTTKNFGGGDSYLGHYISVFMRGGAITYATEEQMTNQPRLLGDNWTPELCQKLCRKLNDGSWVLFPESKQTEFNKLFVASTKRYEHTVKELNANIIAPSGPHLNTAIKGLQQPDDVDDVIRDVRRLLARI
jgi:hypothetical protein